MVKSSFLMKTVDFFVGFNMFQPLFPMFVSMAIRGFLILFWSRLPRLVGPFFRFLTSSPSSFEAARTCRSRGLESMNQWIETALWIFRQTQGMVKNLMSSMKSSRSREAIDWCSGTAPKRPSHLKNTINRDYLLNEMIWHDEMIWTEMIWYELIWFEAPRIDIKVPSK